MPPSQGSSPVSVADAIELLGVGSNESGAARQKAASPAAVAYRAHFNRLTNANGTAALIHILLPKGGSQKLGMHQIHQIRSIAATEFGSSEHGFHVHGEGSTRARVA